eukprot:762031-Hanusia_phi.AAC.2
MDDLRDLQYEAVQRLPEVLVLRQLLLVLGFGEKALVGQEDAPVEDVVVGNVSAGEAWKEVVDGQDLVHASWVLGRLHLIEIFGGDEELEAVLDPNLEPVHLPPLLGIQRALPELEHSHQVEHPDHRPEQYVHGGVEGDVGDVARAEQGDVQVGVKEADDAIPDHRLAVELVEGLFVVIGGHLEDLREYALVDSVGHVHGDGVAPHQPRLLPLEPLLVVHVDRDEGLHQVKEEEVQLTEDHGADHPIFVAVQVQAAQGDDLLHV